MVPLDLTQALNVVVRLLIIDHFVMDLAEQQEIPLQVDPLRWKVRVMPRPVRFRRDDVAFITHD
jgi:hypothetical protein